MDLATWRTTILSSWNSIAASMYIIRRGKIQKGRGQGGGVCLKFFLHDQKKKKIAVMDQYTSVYSKTVVNRKMSYYYGNAEDALVTNKYQ